MFYVNIPDNITDTELEKFIEKKTSCLNPVDVDVYFGKEPKHFNFNEKG